MYYEPESYHREIPDSDKITHLPTGIIYETLDEACQATGFSKYKMRKLIVDGKEWYRPDKIKITRKKVKCLESGIIYESMSAAARSMGVTSSAMSSHLSGRIRSIKGRHFSYTGEVTPPEKSYKRKERRQSDNIAYRLRRFAISIDPEGKFREEWKGKREFRHARFDGKWYWINNSIPTATLSDFQKVLRAFRVNVTLEEARDLAENLFK